VQKKTAVLSLLLVLVSLVLLFASESQAFEGEPELLHLYQYKPIYFLMGNPYTKIEFSFKTQLVENVPVYFGYTQLMFWNLFIPSPYFQDISYNPLFFYRIPFGQNADQWVDLIPIEHESNGLGGLNERSWNRVGAAYNVSHPVLDKARLYLNVKAWIPVSENNNNTDIAQYRGVWEIDTTLSQFTGPFFDFDDLTFRLYPGGESLTNPLHGGQELTLRLKARYRKFLPLFVAQIFHGYGESLIQYQEERWGFRAGIGF
jgi:outer membrane phospholipase A